MSNQAKLFDEAFILSSLLSEPVCARFFSFSATFFSSLFSLYAYTTPFFFLCAIHHFRASVMCVSVYLPFLLLFLISMRYWCWTVLFWIRKKKKRMLQTSSTKKILWDSGYSHLSLISLFFLLNTRICRERKRVSRKDSIDVYISYTTRLFVSIVFFFLFLVLRRRRRRLRELQWMSERKLNEGKERQRTLEICI